MSYYTAEQLHKINATSRERGAIGERPAAWSLALPYLRAAPRGVRVLDFGAGRTMRHVRAYRKELPHLVIEGYDIGANHTREHLPLDALMLESFDVVICSNVLNVQPSDAAIAAIVFDLALVAGHNGVIFASVPKAPMYHPTAPTMVAAQLQRRGFGTTIRKRVVIANRPTRN